MTAHYVPVAPAAATASEARKFATADAKDMRGTVTDLRVEDDLWVATIEVPR